MTMKLFRLSAAIIFLIAPTLAHAKTLTFLCSLAEALPITVTVDDEAKTLTAEANDWNFPGKFKVLSINDKAIFLIAQSNDPNESELRIATLQRSPKQGGVLQTTSFSSTSKPTDIPPSGICWENTDLKP